MGPMLSVSELEKTYELKKTVFSNKNKIIKAVDKISFELHEGKTLGIVGESGSEKALLPDAFCFWKNQITELLSFLIKT